MLESLRKTKKGFTRFPGIYGLSFSPSYPLKNKIRLTYNKAGTVYDGYGRSYEITQVVEGKTEKECLLKMYASLCVGGSGQAAGYLLSAIQSAYKNFNVKDMSVFIRQVLGVEEMINAISNI